MSKTPAPSGNFTWPGLLSGLCGLLCASLGIAVLTGWHTGNASLVRIQAGFVPMQYPTAVCFLVSGAGLMAFALRLPRFLPMACGALAGGIGLLLSAEYLSGWKLGFDALLPHFPEMAGLPPKRSPPPTAAGFALAGTGILLLRMPLPAAARHLMIWILGSSAVALGLMALCAYKLGVTLMFMSGDSISIAAHSAGGITVLGIGLLAAQWMHPQRMIEDRWLPVPVGFATIVAALMLWQALAADRARAVHRQAEVIAQNVAADARSRFTFSLRALNRIKLRWERSGGTPYPEWVSDARDCLQEEPVFEAIGRTDADWRVNRVELDREARPLMGHDLRRETRWPAAGALESSIRNRRMLISPTHPVRGSDTGFAVFFPMFQGNDFTGFFFGVFRLQDLKKSTLDQPAFATCRVSIFEGDRFILGELPVEPVREGGRAEAMIEFRGNLWRFVAEPKSSVLAGGRMPVMILWLGVLLGAAVSGAVWGFQQAVLRTRMALAANRQMKEEIGERQLAERNLRESEKRLGLVLDSATGVSVIAFDLTGIITYFSKGAERLLGCRSGEAVGQPVVPMIHDPGEVAARAGALTAELGYKVEGIETFAVIPRLRGGERGEWTYLRRDGARRTVDLMVTVLEDIDGGTTGYLATAVDITERQRMERDLRETLRGKKTSQALLESAGRIARLGHWELPLDGGGPRWSEITYNIHEVPPGTPVSLDEALNFYHKDDRQAVIDCVAKALESGQPYEFEARLITARGRRIWVYSRGEPVMDENGAVIAMHGVFQDIDDRRQAAELLKRRNIELEAATARAEAHARAKAEFLANMSHEIRTPLNAVIGMSELLMDGRLDLREREFVETIHSSGDMLLSLINDILDFSKIESGQLDLERIPVPLRDCVESVMDLLAGQAARKNLDLLYWIDPEVPAAILGDPVRLRQVLVNLAGNAIKFTQEGEILVKLSVRQGESGALLHTAVIDTGIGIPEGRTDRLFNAFSQVDASTTRRFGGTGLGLAISHRLIRNMGGRIWVESRGDTGSIFQFEIPLEPAGMPVSIAAAASPEGLRSLDGQRVLIVDDSGNSRWILRRHTESWGMRPTTAGNAGEALARITAGEKFDLAIIDAVMPGMDGYGLAAGIRREPAGHGLPILMLTAMGDISRAPKPPGRSGILNKPVKVPSLLQALRNILVPVPPARPAPSAGGGGGGEKPGIARPLRILVAEDNPVNQRVVILHLQRMGYEAAMAGNGLEALEAVGRETFDVILLDVQMPEMDGLEAAREICLRQPADQRPWMIALTANAFGSDRDECLAAGMNDYLSKPVRGENLQHALRAAYEERLKR
ncbi:MAG: response regulator [Verrucomicrobiota bacterium]